MLVDVPDNPLESVVINGIAISRVFALPKRTRFQRMIRWALIKLYGSELAATGAWDRAIRRRLEKQTIS